MFLGNLNLGMERWSILRFGGLSEIFFLESKLLGLSEFNLRWKTYDLT